jgi:hypothetical protein
MKLTTFTYHGTTRPGVVVGDEDLFDAATVPDLPQDMIGLLEAGDPPPWIDCWSRGLSSPPRHAAVWGLK